MKLIPLLLSLSLLSVQVYSLDDPRVPDMLFPFGSDEGDSVVPVGDDVSFPEVNISTGSVFVNHSAVCVSIEYEFTYYLRQSGYALTHICLSVCLSAYMYVCLLATLRKNYQSLKMLPQM